MRFITGDCSEHPWRNCSKQNPYRIVKRVGFYRKTTSQPYSMRQDSLCKVGETQQRLSNQTFLRREEHTHQTERAMEILGNLCAVAIAGDTPIAKVLAVVGQDFVPRLSDSRHGSYNYLVAGKGALFRMYPDGTAVAEAIQVSDFDRAGLK
jgi:hypothetical protein